MNKIIIITVLLFLSFSCLSVGMFLGGVIPFSSGHALLVLSNFLAYIVGTIMKKKNE